MTAGASPTRSLRGGFTLIELIIVAAIVGIIAAIALPAVMPRRSVPEQGARVLMSTFMNAQRMAVSEQRNVIVRFDVPNSVVVLHVDRDHDETVDPGEPTYRTYLGDDVLLGTSVQPRGGESPPVTFSTTLDGMPSVTFRRNGSASEAGAVYLTWERAEPYDERLVALVRSTGRPDVYRYSDGQWEPVRARP